jgi:hypothetical protein
MDKVKETDRGIGERICINGVQEEDEEQVTNITEYKYDVIAHNIRFFFK